jgi:hypothetical protein
MYMRIVLAVLFTAFSLAAHPAEKDDSTAGSSKAAPAVQAQAGAWSHLGYHGGWVSEYESRPLPVAVRLRHRAAASDRQGKKPARK